jgi:hypothetical protein
VGWLRSVMREIWGLFVDDGSFAAAITVWVGFVLLVLRRLAGFRVWGGAVLVSGLAVLLVENVLRQGRKPRN